MNIGDRVRILNQIDTCNMVSNMHEYLGRETYITNVSYTYPGFYSLEIDKDEWYWHESHLELVLNPPKTVTEKLIIVQWIPEEKYGYKKAMRVVESDHERFIVGSRFDFGFFSIATDEGYSIISLPMENNLVEQNNTPNFEL